MALELDRLAKSRFSAGVGICDGSPTPILCPFVEEPATLFDICSVTKTFTAAAILRLPLSLDQPVDQFIMLPPEMAEIRIHHLLTHSSGLADFIGPTGEPRSYCIQDDYQPLSRDEMLDRVRRSRLLWSPGEQWCYSNTGYSLLAAIIELVSGEGYEEYLRRTLLQPLGMHDTGYTSLQHHSVASGRIGSQEWCRPTTNSPSWNLVGNGGLLSTIADLLRWKTAFCTLPEAQRALVAPGIWSGCGVFFQGTHLGTVAYHNGSNTICSATVRWFPSLDRFLAVVSNHSDHSAMRVARAISGCWKEE